MADSMSTTPERKYPFNEADTPTNLGAVKAAYLDDPLMAHYDQILAAVNECQAFHDSIEPLRAIIRGALRRAPGNRALGQVLTHLDQLWDSVEQGVLNHDAILIPQWIYVNDLWGQVGRPADDFRAFYGKLDSYIERLDVVKLEVREWAEHLRAVVKLIDEDDASAFGRRNKPLGRIQVCVSFVNGFGRRRLQAIERGLEACADAKKKEWEDQQILTKLVPVS